MKRKVYLNGELAELFGESIQVKAKTFQEAIKCVDVNRPGFRKYLIDSSEKGIEFKVTVESMELSDTGFDSTLPGDYYITPVPSGAKSGGAKIATALAILALIVINPSNIFLGGNAHLAVGITKTGYVAASIATNLALTGIQQILAPDPATDAEEPSSYLFNGAEQNVLEGDPVPILYGELRVPGTPVSFEILNRKFDRNNVITDADGNLLLVGA